MKIMAKFKKVLKIFSILVALMMLSYFGYWHYLEPYFWRNTFMFLLPNNDLFAYITMSI